MARQELAVTPIVDPDLQFGAASVDVRLGPDITIARRATGVLAHDLADPQQATEEATRYREYVRRPFGTRFHLHPGEFVLARTLEYVAIPPDLSAEALGRSTLGRLGLVIATATFIGPEFHGTITLELANVGTVPIVLHVGMRVAQLTFHAVQ